MVGSHTAFRVATVNVGSLDSRENEVAETLRRRNVDVACLQELKSKGEGARWIVGDSTRYKLYYIGNESGTSAVGIMVKEKWVEQVFAVNRVCSRIMTISLMVGKCTLTVMSVYAPQQGLTPEVKNTFYAGLTHVSGKVGEKEIFILGGDLNGHVGQSSSGYAQVHGGFGYGCRNTEGHRILEYCTAQNLFICNTQFQKRDSHLITYSSGGGNTQIDYILLRAKHKQLVKDTKVIPGEEVFTQHRLVVCDLRLREALPKTKKPFTPKLRVWKLKDPEVREAYTNEVAMLLKSSESSVGVEDTWSGLKSALITASENTCGWTKSHPQQRVTWW